jgi:hypothetical protein
MVKIYLKIPKSKFQIPKLEIYSLYFFYELRFEFGISTIGISYIFSTFDKI